MGRASSQIDFSDAACAVLNAATRARDGEGKAWRARECCRAAFDSSGKSAASARPVRAGNILATYMYGRELVRWP